MKKLILVFFLGALFQSPIIAQDVNACMQDLSIFAEYVKVKNYASAMEPWIKVRENCPDINVAIYTYGERIIKDKIKNGSSEEIEVSKKELIQLYNEWVQYFPKNKSFRMFCYSLKQEYETNELIVFILFMPPSTPPPHPPRAKSMYLKKQRMPF